MAKSFVIVTISVVTGVCADVLFIVGVVHCLMVVVDGPILGRTAVRFLHTKTVGNTESPSDGILVNNLLVTLLPCENLSEISMDKERHSVVIRLTVRATRLSKTLSIRPSCTRFEMKNIT